MSLKKQYFKTKSACKVTFKLPKDLASSAKNVSLAGDLNNWDIKSIPMKKNKDGEFAVSVDLEKGKEYQFKYVINGTYWVNDTEADKYVSNGLESENSVVIV